MKRLALGLLFWLASLALVQAQLANSGQATGTGYPAGATVLAGAIVGANTSAVGASIPGSPGKLSFICGLRVDGLGATALTNVAVSIATVGSVTSPANPNYNYTYPAGVTVAATPLIVTFTPCLPHYQTGQSINLAIPGAAGNTLTNINFWGYWINSP